MIHDAQIYCTRQQLKYGIEVIRIFFSIRTELANLHRGMQLRTQAALIVAYPLTILWAAQHTLFLNATF